MITSDRAIFDYLRLAWSMRRDLPDGAEEVIADLREEIHSDIRSGVHPDWVAIREDLLDWSEEWGLPPPPWVGDGPQEASS